MGTVGYLMYYSTAGSAESGNQDTWVNRLSGKSGWSADGCSLRGVWDDCSTARRHGACKRRGTRDV